MLHDFTYVACGLHAILDQAIEQLWYHWNYTVFVCTTHGYQSNLTITLASAHNSPTVDYTFGRPCPQVCEAQENALTWALIYIDSVRGYRIRDIHYFD